MCLNTLVNKLTEKHIGGVSFFDALDKAVQQEKYLNALIGMVTEIVSNDIVIIVSGKFGRYFINSTNFYKTLYVNGGLRRGWPIDSLEPFREILQSSTCVFLDDSYFSGTTQRVVAEELRRCGAELKHTFVIYDGCRKSHKDVSSLYRYYDNL